MTTTQKGTAKKSGDTARKPSGAKASSKPHSAVSYIEHHKKVLRQSLHELKKRPLPSLFTCAVIGISLVLPFFLFAVISTYQDQEFSLEENATLTIFFYPEVSDKAAKQAHLKFGKRSEFASSEFLDKHVAWEQLATQLDLSKMTDAIEDNPLPHAIKVVLNPQYTEPSALTALETDIRQDKLVEDIVIDSDWIKRLNALSDLAALATTILATLLACAVVLIVGNTIRLSIENRKEEITVLKLVGGTDAFVSRPLLYSGSLLGLGGGITAVIITGIMIWQINQPLKVLLDSYEQAIPLISMSIGKALFIIVSSALLGWIGALLSVKKHLKAIQPT